MDEPQGSSHRRENAENDLRNDKGVFHAKVTNKQFKKKFFSKSNCFALQTNFQNLSLACSSKEKPTIFGDYFVILYEIYCKLKDAFLC